MVIRLSGDKRTIVYAPGFGSGQNPTVVESFLGRLQREGHTVHYVPLSRTLLPTAEAGPERYPAPLWQMAKGVHDYIVNNDLRDVHLIGHSMGAVVVLIVAKEWPDLVKRVAMVCPACIYPTGLLTLACRTTWKGIIDQWWAWRPGHYYREVARLLIKDAHRYIGWRPWELKRVFHEARSLLKPISLELATELVREGKVGVWVIYGDRDVLFNPKRTAAVIDKLGANVVCVPEGRHDLPQLQAHFLHYRLKSSGFLP